MIQLIFFTQLDHRILATTSLISIGALWWSTRRLDIHPAIRSLIGSTLGMAALQVLTDNYALELLFNCNLSLTLFFNYSGEQTCLSSMSITKVFFKYLQVTLGISTLLSYVPVSLGTAHQAGALTLLTLMLLLNHTVRRPSLPLLKSLPRVAKTTT